MLRRWRLFFQLDSWRVALPSVAFVLLGCGVCAAQPKAAPNGAPPAATEAKKAPEKEPAEKPPAEKPQATKKPSEKDPAAKPADPKTGDHKPADTKNGDHKAPEGDKAPTEAEALAIETRKLVRDLDDAELAKRDAAEQKLLQMGPKILSLLPKITERTSAEAKHRLQRLRQKLELAEAEAAVQPTTITIKGTGLPLAEVLAAVEKQTGNKIVDFREKFGQEMKDVRLDLDLDHERFWPGFDKILDLAHMSIYNFSGEQGVAVGDRDEGQIAREDHAFYAGPFRFEAIKIESERDLRNPNQQALKLHVEIAWEPRLLPIALTQPLDQIHVVDEGGQPLAISGEGAELEIPVQAGASAIDLQLPFALPPRSVTKIAQFKAKMRALVPGRVETFRFENAAQANKVELRKGGATVTLDTVRKNNEVWEVRMRLSFDRASGALESHRGWVFRNECYLEDAAGKRIDHGGFETTRQTENEIGVAYLFELPAGPKGLSFVYKTPAAILSLPVEYELQNIELP